MINILEVNNTDLMGRRFNGYDLQYMLNQRGYNAKQIVLKKESTDESVRSLIKSGYLTHIDNYIKSIQERMLLKNHLFSFTEGLSTTNEFKAADVVHYHLIHNINMNLRLFSFLTSLKPSVWTLHDPAALTGYCVHPFNCKNWLDGCHDCPQADKNFYRQHQKNISQMWQIKKQLYREIDITLIVASDWMLKMVKNSPITAHFKNVVKIPFGIDLKVFSNFISKAEARERLKIDRDAIVIFFRNYRYFKGVKHIKEALKNIKSKEKIVLLTCNEIGGLEELKNKYKIVECGWIGQEILRTVFIASDIFLMPSTAETFGVMAIEAMACKLPVIVFENTSLSEVTFAPQCGIAVEWENTDKLKEAIEDLIGDSKERVKRGNIGRSLAEKYYNIELYHKKMIDLYMHVYLNRKKLN